jgi:hypothetical protein
MPIPQVLSCLAVFAFLSLCADAQDSDFQVDVPTDKKPWTHLSFHDDPDHFQFAIVGDRTGGLRPGVFPGTPQRLLPLPLLHTRMSDEQGQPYVMQHGLPVDLTRIYAKYEITPPLAPKKKTKKPRAEK